MSVSTSRTSRTSTHTYDAVVGDVAIVMQAVDTGWVILSLPSHNHSNWGADRESETLWFYNRDRKRDTHVSRDNVATSVAQFCTKNQSIIMNNERLW